MNVVPQAPIEGGRHVTNTLEHPPAPRSKQVGLLSGNRTETIVFLGRILPPELWSAPVRPTVTAPDGKGYGFPPQLVGALQFLATPTSLPDANRYLREHNIGLNFLPLLVECSLATLIPASSPQTKLAMFTGLRLTGLGAPTLEQPAAGQVRVGETPFDTENTVTISQFLYALLYDQRLPPTDFPTQVARLAAATQTPPHMLDKVVLEGLQNLLARRLIRFDAL